MLFFIFLLFSVLFIFFIVRQTEKDTEKINAKENKNDY